MAANIIDPILASCVAGLIGAVGHLWRQNNRLGRLLDHDWSIDADLRDAGVSGAKMQRLSFNIATGRAGSKALEALAKA